ncbi:MAG: preprotein translocase subunit SecE [Lachnospiraceae bacterium]|nr:preprotein translocase subunit SecE [Lachnospiraceae bacterium]
MAEATTKEKGRFKQWWKGLKAEFKKIVWPDKESVAKQTAAVIVITIILGAIVSLLDFGLKELIKPLF